MSDSSLVIQRMSDAAETMNDTPSLDARNTLIPILLQYLVIFLLLEYSFRRGVNRDLRSFSRIHYFLWVSCAIFLAVFVLDQELGHPDHDPILVMRLLRPILLLTVFFFGIAANVYVWEKCDIKWQDMFQTGDNKIGYRELAEIGSLLLCLFSATIFFLLRSDLPGPFTTLPAYLHPLLLYGGIVMLLFSPLQQVFHESRFWFIGQIFRVFTPGCRPVGFMEFWLADQACSLVILFVDCEFLMCWYLVDGTVFGPRKGVIAHCGDYSSIRALFSILPAVIRFIQCIRRFQDSGDSFPHLVNAGKYSTTLLKAAAQRNFRLKQDHLNFVLWVAAETFSSAYCLWWDLTQDWGLLEKSKSGRRVLLRNRIIYKRPFYHFAIVQDMILRFSWAFKLIALKMTALHREETNTILSICEIFRRVVWNFIRIENEQIGRTKDRFRDRFREMTKLPELIEKSAAFRQKL